MSTPLNRALQRALQWLRQLGSLKLALIASVAVHAALLSVRFVDPERFNRIFQDTPLEVILVNATSKDKPDQAKAIAQTSLAGGGDAMLGRASTPMPRAALSSPGDAAQDMQRKLDALQEQQMQMLTSLERQIAALSTKDPQRSDKNPDAKEQEQRRKQLMDMLAEIEKRVQEQNARPKKRYISPATREEIYAHYYDKLRRKIEDIGTQNFPQAAGNKLYGELTMSVTINHDGQVLETEVVEPSGSAALDRRAQSIARAAGPFDTFPQDMRRRADQIVVISRFKFTRDETLETSLRAR